MVSNKVIFYWPGYLKVYLASSHLSIIPLSRRLLPTKRLEKSPSPSSIIYPNNYDQLLSMLKLIALLFRGVSISTKQHRNNSSRSGTGAELGHSECCLGSGCRGEIERGTKDQSNSLYKLILLKFKKLIISLTILPLKLSKSVLEFIGEGTPDLAGYPQTVRVVACRWRRSRTVRNAVRGIL